MVVDTGLIADAEAAAILGVVDILERLADAASRSRVLRYVAERYGERSPDLDALMRAKMLEGYHGGTDR